MKRKNNKEYVDSLMIRYPTSNRYGENELGNGNFHEIEYTRYDLNCAETYKYCTKWHIKANIIGIFVAFTARA